MLLTAPEAKSKSLSSQIASGLPLRPIGLVAFDVFFKDVSHELFEMHPLVNCFPLQLPV
jgi:hypothetical protein